MKNDIFQVTRDQYVGFLSQIKPEARKIITEQNDNYTLYKVYSKLNNIHLCSRKIYNDKCGANIQRYYVYNMPLDEQRRAPIPVQKIILETKEQVQEFFNILNKLSQERSNK